MREPRDPAEELCAVAVVGLDPLRRPGKITAPGYAPLIAHSEHGRASAAESRARFFIDNLWRIRSARPSRPARLAWLAQADPAPWAT